MNDLSGKEWLQSSFSIWRNIPKNSDEKTLEHPATYPIDLAEKIISIFTHKNDMVLDPFAGSGTTALASMNKKRKSICIELSKKYVDHAETRIQKKIKTAKGYKPNFFKGDSRNLSKFINGHSIDLCLTSPPYWNILNRKRSVDNKNIRTYGKSKYNLGNIDNYSKFIHELQIIFEQVYEKLSLNKYCVIVVMDIRKKNKFYPLHLDVIQMMRKIGFEFDDMIVWDRQNEYNNMRPLGYPSVFRINRIHEFILIFRKI